MYNACINSRGELVGIDVSSICCDEYGSTDVQNIEVSEEYYNNARLYGTNYYTYSNGEIILNPNYEQEEQEKRNQERNREIDKKIEELNKMSITDILNGNEENIKIYQDVIQGLVDMKDCF